jgi:3-deoxy-7-phosphoheptulonate synthase
LTANQFEIRRSRQTPGGFFFAAMKPKRAMNIQTDDLRIRDIRALASPEELMRELPCSAAAASTVATSRQAVQRVLHGQDDRLIVVVGPCSIHDVAAAYDYASRLRAERERYQDTLEIVMRVYFEKPRTTVGWKGLINDPDLNGTFNISKGLRLARDVLRQINELGLPAGCEFLDMITPQYIADLVTWGAIGARTTESQVHRELASGLSCPVGFKNGTNGDVRIAFDAVQAASQPHHFMAVTKQGRCAVASTSGNADCHVILRGGKTPNFDAASIDAACNTASSLRLQQFVMVDASHGNSNKKYDNQPGVIDAIAAQIEGGDHRIGGVMIESNLVAGRQDCVVGKPLVYGQSITDGCIDWATTLPVLERLAQAVLQRRQLQRRAQLLVAS